MFKFSSETINSRLQCLCKGDLNVEKCEESNCACGRSAWHWVLDTVSETPLVIECPPLASVIMAGDTSPLLDYKAMAAYKILLDAIEAEMLGVGSGGSGAMFNYSFTLADYVMHGGEIDKNGLSNSTPNEKACEGVAKAAKRRAMARDVGILVWSRIKSEIDAADEMKKSSKGDALNTISEVEHEEDDDVHVDTCGSCQSDSGNKALEECSDALEKLRMSKLEETRFQDGEESKLEDASDVVPNLDQVRNDVPKTRISKLECVQSLERRLSFALAVLDALTWWANSESETITEESIYEYAVALYAQAYDEIISQTLTPYVKQRCKQHNLETLEASNMQLFDLYMRRFSNHLKKELSQQQEDTPNKQL